MLISSKALDVKLIKSFVVSKMAAVKYGGFYDGVLSPDC